MTDTEVETQFSVFAVMLSVPYLNGDHGELPADVRSDIQAIMWRYGYIPAQQLLVEMGATPEQVERARRAKQPLFEARSQS
jgi:hypothetical protein